MRMQSWCKTMGAGTWGRRGVGSLVGGGVWVGARGVCRDFRLPPASLSDSFSFRAEGKREKEGTEKFVCGGEESYGYMLGDYARDKDGIASCAVVAEMTAWAAENKKSLFDVLMDIYMEIGFYKQMEGLIIHFAGSLPVGVLQEPGIRWTRDWGGCCLLRTQGVDIFVN